MRLPGLVDLQVNGYAGLDVNADDVDVDTITDLTRRLWAEGTTRWMPTIVTAPLDRIEHTLDVISIARGRDPLVAESILGVHLEGPWISPEREPRGAHDPSVIRPADPTEVERILARADGLLRMVTIAPEVPGADEAIERMANAGVLVSLGHSAGLPEDFRRATALGATLSTHLGNGCAATMPRHPNILWTQLDLPLVPGVITDGFHCPADFVRTVFRTKGRNAFLVSDSAALAGSPPGLYTTPVGGQVEVTGEGALRLPGQEKLAGSGSSLLQCLHQAMAWGVPQAIDAASAIPIGLLGDPGVESSWRRDSVELDEGRVVSVVLAGRRVI